MSAKYPNVSKTDIDKFYHGKYTQEHLDGSESEYSMNNIKNDLEKMAQDMSLMSESEQQQNNLNESVADSEVSVSDYNEEYKQYNQAYKKTAGNTDQSKSRISAQLNPAKAKLNKVKLHSHEHSSHSNYDINKSHKQLSPTSQSDVEYSVEDKNTFKEKLSKSNIDVTNMSEATLIEINKMMNKYLELDNEIRSLSKQRSLKNKERTNLKNKLEQIMIKYKEAFNKDCVSKKLAEIIGDSTTAEQIATYIYDSRQDKPNVMITRKQNMEHPSVKKDNKAAIPALDWKQIINNLK